MEAPNSESIPIAVPEERIISPVELHSSNSFDSVTSLGTTAMTASSTSWTRSTSFQSSSMTTSFNSSVDNTDNFIHERHSQTTRPEATNLEVKRFVNANYDVKEYELMDIDDLDAEALATYTSDGSQVSSINDKSLDNNWVEHGKPSNRKDAYLVEQFVSSALLSEHMVQVYDMLSGPLISSSSTEFSEKMPGIFSSVLRSDQSFHGYKTASRCILHMFESDLRGI